jgi:hypothetical protein
MSETSIDRRLRIQISPRRLAHISKEVHKYRRWDGSSRGYKMRITLTTQATLSGDRFEWKIRPPGANRWLNGTAGTVFDAIFAMEARAWEAQKEAQQEALKEAPPVVQ